MSTQPADFAFLVLFNISYKRVLRVAHRVQRNMCNLMNLPEPLEYEKSILGFVEKRSKVRIDIEFTFFIGES